MPKDEIEGFSCPHGHEAGTHLCHNTRVDRERNSGNWGRCSECPEYINWVKKPENHRPI